MARKKYYGLTKTKVRETILNAFGRDENKTVKLGDVLALFESSKTTDKNIYDDEGNLIARKCSKLNIYLKHEAFTSIGKGRLSYESKFAKKLQKFKDKLLQETMQKMSEVTKLKELKELQEKYREIESMSLLDINKQFNIIPELNDYIVEVN